MQVANVLSATGELEKVNAADLTEYDLSKPYYCIFCDARVWPRCYYSDKRITHFGGQHNAGCKGPGTRITNYEGIVIREDLAQNHIDLPLNQTRPQKRNPVELTEEELFFKQDRLDNLIRQTLPEEIKKAEDMLRKALTQPGYFKQNGYNLKKMFFYENTLPDFRKNGIASNTMTLVIAQGCSPKTLIHPIQRDEYEMVLRDCGNLEKGTIFFKVQILEPTHNKKFWEEKRKMSDDDIIAIWATWEDVSDEYHRIYKTVINSWQKYVGPKF